MSDSRQRVPLWACKLRCMTNVFDGVIDRFVLSSGGFERRLRLVRPTQWGLPTPCAQWNVRQLVNHMTRGNLNYVHLVAGGSGAEFLRLREVDALDDDPVGAYTRSVRECREAFGRPGALRNVLDYPLGPVAGSQALAVRVTDTTIHTWDLARALGVDDALEPSLITWMAEHLEAIYAGMAETPVSVETTHRFFAAPVNAVASDISRQDRLLRRMGRNPHRAFPDSAVTRPPEAVRDRR